MSFFVVFFVTLGVLAILLGMTGLDFVTALSGAATAVANIGPGLGIKLAQLGIFAGLNDTAKWLLIVGMLLGRLELIDRLYFVYPTVLAKLKTALRKCLSR